jgi:hypothetical protein
MTMAAADPDLLAALKLAKTKKMFFAFIPKGGSDGKLIISKVKIPLKKIQEAKKEISGGTPVTGKCMVTDGATIAFQTLKPTPPTMAAAVKKVAKRDTGLIIDPDFQVAGDAEAEEPDTDTAAGESAPAAASAPSAGAAAPGASKAVPGAASAAAPAAAPGNAVAGLQKALQTLGYDPGKIDGIMGPITQGAIKKFQQASGLAADGIAGPKTQAALKSALAGGAAAGTATAPPTSASPTSAPATPAPTGAADKVPHTRSAPTLNLAPWHTARQKAINDLKALATKVAGTKHATAAAVVKEIQAIITRLPANPGPNDIDKLEEFVRNDATITDAENVPSSFNKLTIRAPLLEALESSKQ